MDNHTQSAGLVGWLPAAVRYGTVSPLAKLLFAELTALCGPSGYSTASNRQFGDALSTTARRAAMALEELVKADHVLVQRDGRTRYLFPILGPSVACICNTARLGRTGAVPVPSLRPSYRRATFGNRTVIPFGDESKDARTQGRNAPSHTRQTGRLIAEWNSLAAACNLEPADPESHKLTRALLRRTSPAEHPDGRFWQELFTLVRQTTRFHGAGWLSLDWVVRNAEAPLKLRRMAIMWQGKGTTATNALRSAETNEALLNRPSQTGAITLKPRRTASHEESEANRVCLVPGASGKALKGWKRLDM